MTFKVTLLGTGTPLPCHERFGSSTLIEAGNRKLLIDAGRGATIRLHQLGIPLGAIDTLLLTHYHSDHTVGIPDLWLTGWLEAPFGRRTAPLHIIGPTGVRELMTHLERAYRRDIEIRLEDERLPPAGITLRVEEFAADCVIQDADGIKVTAFEVDHGDAIKPAFGYRVDYAGRSAVISSDTRYNEKVVRYATGADLLIHEVAMVRPELASRPYIQRIMAHHTTAREAGLVFARTQPKLAAYTHLALLGGDGVSPPTLDDLVAETRQTYDGPLAVGEDLMSFSIAETVHIISGIRS
jgi:ribonuclease Z